MIETKRFFWFCHSLGVLLCAALLLAACNPLSNNSVDKDSIANEDASASSSLGAVQRESNAGSESSLPSSQHSQNEQQSSSLQTEIPKQGPFIYGAPVDLSDLDLVKRVYVWPLIPTGNILSYSWSSTTEISADDLINVCAYNNFLNLPVKPEDGTIWAGAEYVDAKAPAKQVEQCIQEHFDVSVEYLRTSELYDAQNQTYTMIAGWGGGWAYEALYAKGSADKIIIEIGLSSDQGEPEAQGTLCIQVDENKQVKYLSYKLK